MVADRVVICQSRRGWREEAQEIQVMRPSYRQGDAMPVRAFLLLCVALNASAPVASAQFWSRNGDQLTLTINHAAGLKVSLDHVAFAQPEGGPCSTDFADALVADFASSGKLVIDRLHFNSLIAEHKLNVSGLIDSRSAAKIGKLIGTGSLVFVRVHECKTFHVREPNHSIDLKGNISKEQVPTTRGVLKASVQIVDLTTGITAAARVIDAKVAVQMTDGLSMKERFLSAANSLRGGNEHKDAGDYPPDDQATSALYTEAVTQLHHALLPWSETRKITFYDDRECGLNAAYALLQASDFAGAEREAATSVEKCDGMPLAKRPQVARAHFNHGMTLFLTADYAGAMKELTEALRIDSTIKDVQPVMQECSRAWAAVQADMLNNPKGAIRTASKASDGNKTVSAPTVEERLRQLDELHKKNLITDEEYAKKRKAILDAM